MEGIVMACPVIFQRETGDGLLVAAAVSFWREEDTYADGRTGHVQLMLPPQVARDMARRLLEEADKIEGL